MTLAEQIRALKATPHITLEAATLLERAAVAAEKPRKRNLSHLCRGRCCRPGHPMSKDNCGHTNSRYICTLPKGHKGHHIACGTETHSIDSWPNDPA